LIGWEPHTRLFTHCRDVLTCPGIDILGAKVLATSPSDRQLTARTHIVELSLSVKSPVDLTARAPLFKALTANGTLNNRAKID
jgi:hypothetical protein